MLPLLLCAKKGVRIGPGGAARWQKRGQRRHDHHDDGGAREHQRIGRRDPEQHRLYPPGGQEGGGDSAQDAAKGKRRGLAKDHQQNLRGTSSNRDSNSHLAAALTDGMRERGIQADGGDSKRKRAEQAQQDRPEPPRTNLTIEQL